MKKAIISLIVFSLAFPVLAIDADANSPTKNVTTVFSEPVDQYTDVIDFNLLDTSVLFLQFDSPDNNGTNPFVLGVGHSINDFLYLGGNISIQDPGHDESNSSNLSTALSGTSVVDKSRTDTLETLNSIAEDGAYKAELTAGLHFSAFTLGINGFVNYDEGKTTGPVTISGTAHPAALSTLPTVSISSISTTTKKTEKYDSEGNLDETIIPSTNPESEGYVNNGTEMFYGLKLGTQLKLADFALDVRLSADMKNTDNSAKATNKYYTTNYESKFSDYLNVKNATSVNKTTAEKININNQLSIFGGVSTVFKALTNFDLESGIFYDIEMDNYNDGGIKTTYTDIDYDASNVSEFVLTKTTTTETTIKQDISRTKHQVMLPITFTSNFSDRFVIGIKNNLYYSQETTETTNSYSSVQTYDETTTDAAVADIQQVTTRNYLGSKNTTTTTTISDFINAGAKFYLTDKVRINLGSQIILQPITYVQSDPDNSGKGTETVQKLINGQLVETSTNTDVSATDGTNTSTNTAATTSISYSAGLTYFLNDNLIIDLMYEVPGGIDEADGNIWSVSNWSLLLTAKY